MSLGTLDALAAAAVVNFFVIVEHRTDPHRSKHFITRSIGVGGAMATFEKVCVGTAVVSLIGLIGATLMLLAA
jgi:hypothetical protein